MKKDIVRKRDLTDYSHTYPGPFEEIQARYRTTHIKQCLALYKPRIILEVGCGTDSAVNHLDSDSYDRFYIVEPITAFLDQAIKIKSDKIKQINMTIEQVTAFDEKPDLIIVSSLLHEVIDPGEILRSISHHCKDETMVYVSVPNARSFHRLLGLEMDIIQSIFEKSGKQKELQQHHIFDMKSLIHLIDNAGFKTIEKGSFFLKLFTHQQMQQMLDSGIFSPAILDGLYNMNKYLPEMGSEIYAVIQRKSTHCDDVEG
jgi:2-polyprenyl-3-methyl-5-hydroxy-6-metoxy-1,4-benzoquinol methylase